MAVEVTRDGQTVTVEGVLESVTAVSGEYSVSASGGASGGIPYDGVYEVTPSEQEQVLRTGLRALSQDIVVNPIPSNYGLITYDGSAITVS